MRKKTPKTGLAASIRAWASGRKKPFRPADLCGGIGVPPSGDRNRVRRAMTDFMARGEIERAGDGRYRYNHAWKRLGKPPVLKAKLLKAAYVAGPAFTVADLMRWSEAPDRSYVQKVLRRLIRSGHVARAGTCRVPLGRENLYRVPDRERFRKELL